MRVAAHTLASSCQRAKASCAQQASQSDLTSLDANAREELYKRLIDYATGCVARLATSYGVGATWSKVNLAVLGQIAVKLNFLARDIPQQVEASLHHADALMHQLQTSDGNTFPRGLPFGKATEMEGYYETFVDDYVRSSQRQQKFVMSALRRAFSSLILIMSPRREQYLFQSSLQIYTVGPDQTGCVVKEDRSSGVSVTSTHHHVDLCRTGMSLVHKNFHYLGDPQTPPPPAPDGAEPVAVGIYWRTAGTSIHTSNLKVYTMDALVSLTLPLSLCAPQLGELAEQMVQCLYLGAELDIVPLRRDVATDKCASLVGCTIQSKSALNLGLNGLQSDYDKHRKKSEGWIISDNSVTVKRPWYVIGVLLFCAGVALAFTVPMGLKGGDPFQYFYCTTAAIGMILFMAKSVWMSDWPWDDFLRGRIVCHSVSEVAAVSRMDAQIVLLKLLDHARVSRFNTQGPFNILFRHLDKRLAQDGGPEEEMREKDNMTRIMLAGAAKAEPRSQLLKDLLSDAGIFSGGFSIEKPIELRTLQASGFLVLKVAGYDGEHLVCLDARKDETVDFMERNGENAVLSCPKLPVVRKGETPIMYLSENRLEWARLLGVYTGGVVFG
ncbi:hypothetical protein PG984_015257 [Apiospora sp. TS-2023a]